MRPYNPYAPPGQAADALAKAQPRSAITAGELELARPSQRLLAKLIDRGLLAGVVGPGVVVQVVWDTHLGIGLWTLMSMAFACVQWSLIAFTGQTLGKRWLGLRVISEKRERVGLLRGVVLRVWVMWIGSMSSGGFVLLLDPWFVLGNQRKAIHDSLAGTLVIVANTAGDPYESRR